MKRADVVFPYALYDNRDSRRRPEFIVLDGEEGGELLAHVWEGHAKHVSARAKVTDILAPGVGGEYRRGALQRTVELILVVVHRLHETG